MFESKIDDVLSITESMSLDEQYTFLDKFKQRLIERRRKEMLNHHKEAIEKAEKGELTFTSNTDDLMKLLD